MVDAGSMANAALSIGIMIFVCLFVGSIAVAITVLYLRWKKYQDFECIIFRRDGFGQLSQKKDMAGIFVDGKTKNKRFFLKREKVGLDPDNVPFLQGMKGNKTVYLFQTGLKNFQFIRVNIDESRITLNVGEEDVNWAINSYERQKKLFQQSIWIQILPFIVLAFISIVILIIFIYFFKNFDVLKDVAVALKEAATQIAQAKSGTTVVGG